MAGDIDEVLHGEAQTIERAPARRWQRESLDERAGLLEGNGWHIWERWFQFHQ
jgi:hypothetical protein